MGRFVHEVSTLNKITFLEAFCYRVKFGFYGKIESILNGIGNAFCGFQQTQNYSDTFYGLANDLYEYRPPEVITFNSMRFLQTHLRDDKGQDLLISIGVKSTFDIDSVYGVGNGDYVLSFWYFNGGSDGMAERESFLTSVQEYFDNLNDQGLPNRCVKT